MTRPLIVYSPDARADLLAIENYISQQDGEARAGLISGRLEEAILNLAYMPGLGRSSRALADPGARVFPVSPWLIFYSVLPNLDGIAVLRIVDGRRDLAEAFSVQKGRRGRGRRRPPRR